MQSSAHRLINFFGLCALACSMCMALIFIRKIINIINKIEYLIFGIFDA